jgi:hypothetical protein
MVYCTRECARSFSRRLSGSQGRGHCLLFDQLTAQAISIKKCVKHKAAVQSMERSTDFSVFFVFKCTDTALIVVTYSFISSSTPQTDPGREYADYYSVTLATDVKDTVQRLMKVNTLKVNPCLLRGLCTYCRYSVQVRGPFWHFVTNLFFYGEELLALRPTPKLEDHPLSAVGESCIMKSFITCIVRQV